MKNVTIYSTPTCGFCHLAKEFFQQHNIPFAEKNVAVDLTAREEMFAKTNQMGVPVIDIDGQTVIGFDQPKLSALLGL